MFFNRYPLASLNQLHREMDGLFDGCFDELTRPWFRHFRLYPAINVWGDDECLYAEVEVPGMSMDNLEVYAIGNELTIKGRRTAPEKEDVVYHRRERCVGEFTRTLTLPVEVDADKVEAALKDGVLSIKLPKAEAAKVRRIPVKVDE